MAVRTITTHLDSVAVMYCSTTDWAFGPVFYDSDEHSADERIHSFLRWLQIDARSLPDNILERKYSDWRAQEAEQWEREEEEERVRLNENEL